jgi:hypothetical protein
MSVDSLNFDLKTPYLYIANDASNSLLNRKRLYLNIGIYYDIENVNSLLILNTKGKLFLSKEDGKKYPLQMSADDLYINNSGSSSFSAPISKSEIDLIDKWRNKDDLNAEFVIEGLVLLPRPNNSIIYNVKASRTFEISESVFNKQIMTPCDLLSSYYREFESEFTKIILNTRLDEFIESIRSMHCNLRIALQLLKESKDSGGYNHVLSQIREPLDTVLNFKNDKDIIKELENMLSNTDTIVTTKILKSPTPNQKYTSAQNEVILKLFDLIEIIHSFTSKSQHTLYRQQTSAFNMNAEIEDAEFMLTLAYSIVAYLNTKLAKMNKIT